MIRRYGMNTEGDPLAPQQLPNAQQKNAVAYVALFFALPWGGGGWVDRINPMPAYQCIKSLRGTCGCRYWIRPRALRHLCLYPLKTHRHLPLGFPFFRHTCVSVCMPFFWLNFPLTSGLWLDINFSSSFSQVPLTFYRFLVLLCRVRIVVLTGVKLPAVVCCLAENSADVLSFPALPLSFFVYFCNFALFDP